MGRSANMRSAVRNRNRANSCLSRTGFTVWASFAPWGAIITVMGTIRAKPTRLA